MEPLKPPKPPIVVWAEHRKSLYVQRRELLERGEYEKAQELTKKHRLYPLPKERRAA